VIADPLDGDRAPRPRRGRRGRSDSRDPSPAQLALAGELLGAGIRITRAPGLARLPLEGTIVDESRNLFVVRPTGAARRARRIPKRGLEATILLGEKELPLRGDDLRMRPEDRTKRLASRSPRTRP
jgi:RNase P/RNase MRP subunit p29